MWFNCTHNINTKKMKSFSIQCDSICYNQLTLYRTPDEQCHTTPSTRPLLLFVDSNQSLTKSSLKSGGFVTFSDPCMTRKCNGVFLFPIPVKKNLIIEVRVMVFNATFNNISVILWWSVLLVEETRVPRENHWPAANHRQTLSHNVVSSTPRYEQDLNSQL